MPTAQQEAAAMPEMTNTDRLVNATHALVQAERTGDKEAIKAAETLQAFYERQVMAEGARQREADRLTAIGPAGRYDETQAAAHSTYHL
jgi:hypothetical protein